MASSSRRRKKAPAKAPVGRLDEHARRCPTQGRKALRAAPADQVQEELRASKERLESLLENSPLAVIEWSTADYRIVRWSGEATRIFGWTAEEAVGKRIDELDWVYPEDQPLVQQVMSQMLSGVRSRNVNRNRNVRKDGEVIHCEWYNSTFHDASGAFSVLSLVLDVTERKRTGESLRQSEERFRVALQDSPVMLATLDRDLRFTWAYNLPRGLSLQSTLGKRPDELASLADAESAMRGLRAVLETGKPRARLMSFELGGERWHCEARAEPLRDEQERVAGLTLALIDITEQKQAEEALREADRRKDEFLAILSHELRNPLAPIKASLHLLNRVSPYSEQALRAREVIARQSDHLANLVDELLDVTRISRGKVYLDLEKLDLGEVVRGAVEDNRALFEAREVALELSLSAGPLLVEADRTRLAQIVGNLLQNAAKFTGPGGRARVSAGVEHARAVLRVADTGMGMAPETLARVFVPFMQADTSLERASGGLGLGLALVKSLVELHGGEVSAHSAGLGKGSELVVRLPMLAVTQAEEAPARQSLAAEPRGHRVLVIDDNADFAETVQEVLELSGHQVQVAHSGPDGVAKARALMPEIVFCDIGLPGMSGYDVARELRASPALAQTVLVALTGYALPEDLRRAREAGFARHLAKPPALDALESLVDELPRREAAGG